jgi:Mn-containing catalase
MFRHTDYLQFDAAPEKPDPVYAHKLQELIGGAYGEMTVTMQYLFQGWSCRMPGKYVRNMLKFNLARDTLHENLCLKAIEELQADGLETTVAPNALFDEEYAEHATSVWHLSDGKAGAEGGWASGPQPDGRHEFGYLQNPEPLGPRHRTRSCTPPTTAPWANPPGPP